MTRFWWRVFQGARGGRQSWPGSAGGSQPCALGRHCSLQGRRALGLAHGCSLHVLGKILPMLQTRSPCRGTGKKGLINCWIVITGRWRRTPKRWWWPVPQPETVRAGHSPGHLGVSCQTPGMSCCSRTDPHIQHWRKTPEDRHELISKPRRTPGVQQWLILEGGGKMLQQYMLGLCEHLKEKKGNMLNWNKKSSKDQEIWAKEWKDRGKKVRAQLMLLLG